MEYRKPCIIEIGEATTLIQGEFWKVDDPDQYQHVGAPNPPTIESEEE